MPYELLDRIKDYKDLKKYNYSDLDKLCKEIRDLIINVVSKNGGHLSSNLGSVELTVAMLLNFNPANDDIIFDVGHQSYTYKILTGRKDSFNTIRIEGGISGFPDPRESIYDKFIMGHSSTSLSIGSGFATYKKITNKNNYTVALIGDGALTGGEAFEALNNIGHNQQRIIVILNDNELSISKNVGSLSKHLSNIRSNPLYRKMNDKYKNILLKFGFFGKLIIDLTGRIKSAIKQFILPEMIFEELGFVYLGPTDGHNIFELNIMLERAKKYKKPVLVHVVTKKGAGFCKDNDDAIKFHSTPPFIIEKNCNKTASQKKETFSDIFGKALLSIGHEDKKVIAVTAAMCDGLCMTEFARTFPERFFDLGIAEQNVVTFSAALSIKGLKPIVGIYSTFLQRAYDQIIHDCCILSLPVIFVVDRAGAVSDDGPTHQGSFDIACLYPIPNTTIMTPSSSSELEKMLKWSINNANMTTFIRYPKDIAPIHNYEEDISFGKAFKVRDGKDCTILSTGSMIEYVLKAYEILKENNIDSEIIDMRFIKPFDEKVVQDSAKKTRFIVTIEDGIKSGGFSEKILSFLKSSNVKDFEFISFGLDNIFPQTMKRKNILRNSGIFPENIAQTILNAKKKS